MNWKPISGHRELFNLSVKSRWSRLTDAQIEALAGNRMALVGRIRSAYGISQERADKQVTSWTKRAAATGSAP